MTEKELIERSLQKDEAAFSELMKLYQDKIYQHLIGLVKDEMLAEDLKQDTFLQAYQKLDTFKQNSSFYTWIYRISHNKALNALRHKNLMKGEIFEESMIAQPISETSEWQEELLPMALAKLPIKQAQVFELYYLQKKPQKEIAAQLNVPLGTIRSRLFYAKKKIRKLLHK